MKILQINKSCGIGSTGRIATDLHKVLQEQGHESYIAYGRNNPQNCTTNIRIGSKIDNYIHALYSIFFDKQGFGSKRATKRFIEKIDKLDPDIIHLHNLHGYYLNIEVLFEYLQQAKKPVIWTLHDCWAFTGHCVHFDYIGCEKWKTECDNCPQRKNYPPSIIDDSKNNYLKKKELFTGVKEMTIVTPSNWLGDLVKQSFLGKYPLKVINNGIDVTVFKPINKNFREKYNLINKFIILGVASKWNYKKGFDTFLELAKLLHHDEVIVLVGLSRKQKNRLPDNIIGITRTNNIKELVEVYSTADVFVNPTLEDVFPLVNIEALACGTPVITYNTGGSIEPICDDTGIIVSKNNITDLRKSIDIIKSKTKASYAKNCRLKIVNKYNAVDKYKDYIKLYHALFKERSN